MIITRLKQIALLPLLLVASMALGAGDIIEFRSDSPQRYVVVKGDTLWDISERFLMDPWLWPEVWQSNPQIQNPDLIYPGDTIRIIYVEGMPMLTLTRGEELRVVTLSPQVRREPLPSPIPTIPLEDIAAFLSENRVLGVAEVEDAPSLLGSQGGQRFSTEGDIVYALGSWPAGETSFDIVRDEGEVKDQVTGKVIGIEAIFIGTATMLLREGEQATLVIDKSVKEVAEGDRFLPQELNILDANYFPQPPSFQVDATIIDIDFGRTYGGARDTVILNVGERDRVEVGHVLSMQKADHIIGKGRNSRSFTGETFGRVLIYQVFKDFSLALVVNSELPVELNDRANTP